MFSTLLAVKREQKTIPRSFSIIHSAVAKIELEASNAPNGDNDEDDDDNDDNNVHDAAIVAAPEPEDAEFDDVVGLLFKAPEGPCADTRPVNAEAATVSNVDHGKTDFTLFSIQPRPCKAIETPKEYSGVENLLAQHDKPDPPTNSECAELGRKRKRLSTKSADPNDKNDEAMKAKKGTAPLKAMKVAMKAMKKGPAPMKAMKKKGTTPTKAMKAADDEAVVEAEVGGGSNPGCGSRLQEPHFQNSS